MFKVRKIVVVLLACGLLMVSGAMAKDLDTLSGSDEFVKLQHESVERYNKLINGMTSDIQTHYGGAYIDEDLNLVVLLNDIKTNNIISVKQLIGNENTIIKSCEYTYRELVDTINIIVDNMICLMDLGVLIDSVQDNLYNNQVEIFIRDLDDSKINIVKSIIDKPYMVFNNSEKGVETCSDIKGGYEIESNTNGGLSTLGFCAYKSGVEGYVISGHAGDNIGEEFKYNGTIIGDVDVMGYTTITTVDASFVESNGNGTLTDNIVPGDIVGAMLSDLPVGTTIYFYGKNSGIESGQIISNNYAYITGGHLVSDCIRGSFSPVSGDSGGPVYYIGSGGYVLMGVVNTSTGGCTKYENIARKLGITCKTN